MLKLSYYIDSGDRLKFLSERKVIINCEIIFHNFTQGSDVTINVVNFVVRETSLRINIQNVVRKMQLKLTLYLYNNKCGHTKMSRLNKQL